MHNRGGTSAPERCARSGQSIAGNAASRKGFRFPVGLGEADASPRSLFSQRQLFAMNQEFKTASGLKADAKVGPFVSLGHASSFSRGGARIAGREEDSPEPTALPIVHNL
jgi:hypothetical protein